MKYIFLDTNIFIHFQSYDQIAWNKIVKDEYKIIIAPIVQDELDKHKRSSNNKIAKRVKQIIKKIDEQEEINHTISTLCKIPSDNTFIKYGLSRHQQDHSLLAAIIEFSNTYGLENVLLVTDDRGVRLRAKNLGIKHIKLDDEYSLPTEDSKEKKELKRLQKENAELKNALPDVKITFDNNEDHKLFEIKPITETEDEYCFRLLKPIKKQYRSFAFEYSIKSINSLANAIIQQQNLFNNILGRYKITQEQKEKYDNELDLFYSKYEKIFKDKYKWDKILSNAVKLDLLLLNKGSAPAKDIDVFLTFPDTVELLFSGYFPLCKKPKPPYKPKHAHDVDMSGIGINYMLNPPSEEYIDLNVIDESCVEDTIEHCNIKNDSKIVQYKFSESLKHNLQLHLQPIWAISKENFKMEYKILIANYPEQVTGELNVIIT